MRWSWRNHINWTSALIESSDCFKIGLSTLVIIEIHQPGKKRKKEKKKKEKCFNFLSEKWVNVQNIYVTPSQIASALQNIK